MKKIGKAPQKSNPNAPKIALNTKKTVPNKEQTYLSNKMSTRLSKPIVGAKFGDKGEGIPFQEKKADPLIIKRRRYIASNCKGFTNYDVTPKYVGYKGSDKASDYIIVYYLKEKCYIIKRIGSPLNGDFIIHDHYVYVFGITLVRVDINGYCNDVVSMNKQINKYRAGLCSDSNGIIYYLCGLSRNKDVFDMDCEKYNTMSNKWTNLPTHNMGGQSLCVASKRSLYLLLTESNNLYKLPIKNSETNKWEKMMIDAKMESIYCPQIQYIHPNRVLMIRGNDLNCMQLFFYNEETQKSEKLLSNKKSYWAEYIIKQSNNMNMMNCSYLHKLPNFQSKIIFEVWENAVGVPP